ncbi:MAG: sigma-70 family RNA polymerase sigma factor, partial [Candidatus Peribacteraceae bacterium]
VIGMELREACQKTSISLHKYYKLTLNRKAIVDAIRRGLGQTADEPKRKRRMRIPDHTDHKDRMTYVERTRKRLQEGANLGDLLARDGIPVRLYFKWAGEAEQAAAAQEQADGNGEGESPVFVAWKAFGRNKHDQKARNVLMAHYLPMVRTIGEKISVTLPRFIDVNDLVQEGVFGLDDALNGFDPGRGKSFRHYATTRIWGSMMDYLREQDWVPRVERQQYNHVRDAAREAYLKDGHGPDQQPDAEQPALAESNGNGHPLSLPLPRMISMSNPVHSGPRADKPQPLGDTLTDESTENSGSKLGKQEFMRFVLTGCNTTERLVMILYYYEEMTMKEIGEALDVSESRVSQIHSTVVERQRAVLHDRLSAY